MDMENRPYWFRRLLWVLILLGSAFALYIVRNTLIPLFISMLIAYLLTPLADYLEHRGFGRILAITTTFFLFFGLIVLVVLYLFPLIRDQVVDLTTALPRTLALLNTFSIFPLLILVPLISFFFLKDGRRIKRGFFNSVPNRYFETVMGLTYEVDQKIGNYVRGQLLRSVVIGFLTYFGLKICGLKYALLLAIFAGVMNLIPYAGPFIASIPAVILAILHQSTPQALLPFVSPLPLVVHVIVVYLMVQTLDAIWVAPYILGWSVDIHPLGIVLVLLFGNQLFGWWGIILAVPAASIIKLTVQAVSNRYRFYPT